MPTKGDYQAFPSGATHAGLEGLSKREWFAGMALMGLMEMGLGTIKRRAEMAVEAADSLIEILNREDSDERKQSPSEGENPE